MEARESLSREEAAGLLGLAGDADPRQVRRAFRLWAALAHPDHGGTPDQFHRLCLARDVLLQEPWSPRTPSGDADSPQPEPSAVPRRPWRAVLRSPSATQVSVLVLVVSLSLASVVGALIVPAAVALGAAALAATATCVLASRFCLRGGDHGHVIVTRSIAWGAVTAGQCAMAALAGVAILEALPLLAVPFVAAIAMVNPGAGFRRVNVR